MPPTFLDIQNCEKIPQTYVTSKGPGLKMKSFYEGRGEGAPWKKGNYGSSIMLAFKGPWDSSPAVLASTGVKNFKEQSQLMALWYWQ